MFYPEIIQGGMGIGVSNWKLARTVSQLGQLGVVSGTAIDTVMIRRLQNGDNDGSMRRALAHFPLQSIATKILERYFIPGGKDPSKPYRSSPMFSLKTPSSALELAIASSFAEVFLAKEGHNHPVGINLLTKIKLPNTSILFGALLAGVDYVLMGAGIPLKIPGLIDDLVKGIQTGQKIESRDSQKSWWHAFDPKSFFPTQYPTLKRPKFIPIISSTILALTLAKKANGPIDGFVIEYPTAGGHNAPPRDKSTCSLEGEPIYTDRDMPDLGKIKKLNLPFWLAGGFASPEKLAEAKAFGASGVQIGTAFALCKESGLTADLKQKIIVQVKDGSVQVKTDAQISPTGFPFKVVQVSNSISDTSVVAQRVHRCDLGYLREIVSDEHGKTRYRCPAENTQAFLAKGGTLEATQGKQCVCNSLCASVGLGQTRAGYQEPPLITAGNSLKNIIRFIKPNKSDYSAQEVIQEVLGHV